MGLREDLIRRMERKRAEIAELQTQIRIAQEYLQALEDTFRLIPKDSNQTSESKDRLRAGTSLAKARDAILRAGKPLHINELLVAVGKGTTRNERAGLSGTLAAYVRKGEIFTRPAPNTFGLVSMKDMAGNSPEPQPSANTGVEIDPGGFLMEPEPDREEFALPTPPKGFGKI